MKRKLITIFSSLLLVAILASLLVFLPACNEGEDQDTQNEQVDSQGANEKTYQVDELKIGILADIQLIPEEYLTRIDTDKFLYFLDRTGNFKMPELTEAIYKTSVDDLIEANVDVAFLIGDLTDNGSVLGMEIIAEGCAKLEAAGIPTFVTNGLCDVNHYRVDYVNTYTMDTEINDISDTAPAISEGEFLDMFADYGYGEAVSRDSHSLSYAADIPGTNYRLIVVDGASFFEEPVGAPLVRTESTKMPEGEMQWIEQALLDAKATAKDPLVITNIPVNPKPLSYYTDFIADTHLTMQEGAELEVLFAEYDVKYVFSGHYHINSELNVSTEKGDLTEIYTSNTCTYPCTIRYFNINKDYSYNTERALIETLDSQYLTKTNISKEAKVAVSTGFVAYSKLRVNESVTQTVNANMYRKAGLDLLIHFFIGLDMYPSGDPFTDSVLERLDKQVLQWMVDYNSYPIYGKDVVSVESICAKYGLETPNSRYAGHSVREFIFNIVYRVFDGTFMVEEAEIDSLIFNRICQAGLMTMADLELFATISEIIPLVVDCDMHKVVEHYMYTGIVDLTVDNFLLATISLFFPFIKQEYHIDLSSIKDVTGLLETFDIIMPVLSAGIPDLGLFCDESGKLERPGCYSLKNATIYGESFIQYIMFSVIVRSTLII